MSITTTKFERDEVRDEHCDGERGEVDGLLRDLYENLHK